MVYRVDQIGRNRTGRDFIIGDIHGMLDKLYECLDSVNFDYEKDRLFSVGDLIDRGGQSYETLQLTYQKWFYAILGNHEVMLLTGHLSYARDWFLKLTEVEQAECLNIIREMPLALEIETEHGNIGLIHAQFPSQFNDWNDYKDYVAESDLSYEYKSSKDKKGIIRDSLWSRKRIYYELKKGGLGKARHAYFKFIKDGLWNRTVIYRLLTTRKTLPYLKKGLHFSWKVIKDLVLSKIHLESHIKNITYTVHGHTPVKTPLLLGNQFFIDTGAVYGCKKEGKGAFTLIEVGQEMKFHSFKTRGRQNDDEMRGMNSLK